MISISNSRAGSSVEVFDFGSVGVASQSSRCWLRDLTEDGDVESHPGPVEVPVLGRRSRRRRRRSSAGLGAVQAAEEESGVADSVVGQPGGAAAATRRKREEKFARVLSSFQTALLDLEVDLEED